MRRCGSKKCLEESTQQLSTLAEVAHQG
jgi:hypothetical protein